MLIVNTANHCRFTYQFEDLQRLYKKFAHQGFVILGFPSNQFAEQNPENGQETATMCKVKFGVTFPIFEVIDVNGEHAHPLFQYLKEQADCREFGVNLEEKMLKTKIQEINPFFLDGKNIRWNFTKFLVDANGQVLKRFEPTDSIIDLEHAIEEALKAAANA
ncbi:glutathione peroxidase [Geobacillus thermodenitrificans]|jgi:glutathione peroxidase|nr:glutathione peroxidase [Geobacillus thermodenitrificans]MEC5187837.1 glutathione peroxidase [Geobacillus thermodenitrificans]